MKNKRVNGNIVKIGDWFMDNDGIYCVTLIQEDLIYWYGVEDGVWIDDDWFVDDVFINNMKKISPKKAFKKIINSIFKK